MTIKDITETINKLDCENCKLKSFCNQCVSIIENDIEIDKPVDYCSLFKQE
jgi:hypothetical protein